MKRIVLKFSKVSRLRICYRELSSSNGLDKQDDKTIKTKETKETKDVAEFRPIVGTDHSYVKMNWMLNFLKGNENADQEGNPLSVSLIYEPKLSMFNIEKDESDDIENVKMVLSGNRLLYV